MYAEKVNYLEGKVFYVFDNDGDRIATVNEGVVLWEDGNEEPYRGATEEVLEAVREPKEAN